MRGDVFFLVATCFNLTAVSALADAILLEAALATPAEGYQSEIDEQTDTHIAVWSWKIQNEDDYYITEINVGGPIVAGFKNTFSAMTFTMDTVEAGGHTFTFDGDMYTTLINNAVLVRVYGPAPEVMKFTAVQWLDFEAIQKLADEN